jgi:predicted O-methyltransferase YrrM
VRTFLHCCRVIAGLDEPTGQITDRELAILVRHAAGSNVIVEIGTLEGKTAVAMARATRGRVYSIDPFFSGRLGIGYGEIIARVARRRAGVRNLQFIKAFSYDAAPSFAESIDMVFIDADHSYEAVRRDWADWTPKVRPGGIVAMHDTRIAPIAPLRLGSMDFFDREVATNPDYELIDSADALSVMRKRA